MNEIIAIGSLFAYAALIVVACRLGKEFVFVFGTFAIVASNAIVGYEIDIFGFTTLFIVIIYCMNFFAINCLTEFYSKKDANRYVLNMAFTQFLFYIFILSASHLILEGDGTYKKAVDTVFAATPRVTLAAMLSHILLFIDASVYKFFKDKEGQGWYGQLWFRAGLSALVTHFIVNIVFFTVAFYGTLENTVLVQIILSNMLIKYAVSFLETPLMYVARAFMAGKGIKNTGNTTRNLSS